MNEHPPQPRLIGFAGHRRVDDRKALTTAIREELAHIREKLGPRLITLSSAAAGADLIFLRACVELRIPAIIVLPFPEERFAQDFDDTEEWGMAEKLMSVSLAKYVVAGGHEAPEAYQVVSRHLVEWADAFLFAWNGERPLGKGGTGETVEEARDLGIPARIIDTGSMTVRWTHHPDPQCVARHGFATRKELLEFLDARFAVGK